MHTHRRSSIGDGGVGRKRDRDEVEKGRGVRLLRAARGENGRASASYNIYKWSRQARRMHHRHHRRARKRNSSRAVLLLNVSRARQSSNERSFYAHDNASVARSWSVLVFPSRPSLCLLFANFSIVPPSSSRLFLRRSRERREQRISTTDFLGQ